MAESHSVFFLPDRTHNIKSNEFHVWHVTLKQSSNHGALITPPIGAVYDENDLPQACGVAGPNTVEEACEFGTFEQGRAFCWPVLVLVFEYAVALFREVMGQSKLVVEIDTFVEDEDVLPIQDRCSFVVDGSAGG